MTNGNEEINIDENEQVVDIEKDLGDKIFLKNFSIAIVIILVAVIQLLLIDLTKDCDMLGCMGNFVFGIFVLGFYIILVIVSFLQVLIEYNIINLFSKKEERVRRFTSTNIIKFILSIIGSLLVISAVIYLLIIVNNGDYYIHRIISPYLIIGFVLIRSVIYYIERNDMRKFLNIKESRKVLISPIVNLSAIITWTSIQIVKDILYFNSAWVPEMKTLYIVGFVMQILSGVLVFSVMLEMHIIRKRKTKE